MKNSLFSPAFFALLFSCQSCKTNNRNQPPSDVGAPTKKASKIFAMPENSPAPPEIIKPKNVKIIKAGQPVVRAVPSNSFVVSNPQIVAVNSSSFFSAARHIYKLPETTPAVGKTKAMVMPEVVSVKDATIADHDPASFSCFKTLQGLKHPLIKSMMQDKNGNIWFGTYSGGVSKYDGKCFTNYTTEQGLGNDGIWSMLCDSKGNCWFGSYGGGVSKFDGKTFTNYKVFGSSTNNIVWDIVEDKAGNLWLGTNDGLAFYNGQSFSLYTTEQGLPNNNVHCIIQDKAEKIWLATFGGLAKFDGKTFVNYTKKNGLASDSILSLVMDKKENIWIGGFGGLTKFDGKSFSNYTPVQGFNYLPVQSICQDQIGKIWLGTAKGLVMVDETSANGKLKTWEYYTTKQGLSNDDVTCILVDRAGNFWLGTNGGGAVKFDGRVFTHFTTVEGLAHNKVMRTVEDNSGALWFATWGGGISKYDGKSFVNYSTSQGLSSNNVFSLLIDKSGVFWLGTGKGITRFDGRSFTNYGLEQGLTNDEVWSIMEDRLGNLWFGSFGSGIYKYDGKQFTHFAHAQGLSNEIVMCMIQDNVGAYWFGTYGGGVNRYDGKSFDHLTSNQGLSNDEVMNIMQDKRGAIWIGTIGGGVDKFDGKFLTNYSTAQGLSNEIVMGILEDQSGNLWFATRNGINKMLPNPLSPSTSSTSSDNKPIFKNYLYADGFLGVNCYNNSFFQDSKGNIWAGAGDRLTCYHPEGETPDTIPPNIYLSNVNLFNEHINWLDLEAKKDTNLVLANGVIIGHFSFDSLQRYNNVPSNLRLNYNNNYLTFEYVGITTQSPYKVRYKYKLEGLDENWSGITNRTEASYGNLPFGKYTFKVKAMNSEGYWSKELDYSFVISPPWWKTTWFRIAECAFIILVLYSIYRYRLNQILRLQAIRNKIAHDLHDDIGSTLNSISVFSEVARQDATKQTQALEMIGESSRRVIDTMSDIVWTINPQNDSFENIILRMRSLAFNLLRAKNIEFTFHADEILNHLKLSMENRRNFFLLFKEALNNMVKYSEASKASIQLRHEQSLIKLVIRDNGNGFDTTGVVNGNGLNSMKRRAVEMKAQLIIESTIGGGTIIRLTLKS